MSNNTLSLKLERYIGLHFPAPAARIARRFGVFPRYLIQSQACRKGFKEYGALYPHKILFVAGLPKSGTTWVASMISSYPGFNELLIPDQTLYDLATGGSHDYDIPTHMFDRLKNMLVLTKMHVHGSKHNVQALSKAGVKYVVVYRDLRDVAVSAVFYIKTSRWHPEFPHYDGLTVEEGLKVFASRTLRDYISWVQSWHQNHNPELGLILRYEKILENPVLSMTRVAKHFKLNSTPETINKIVESHRFNKMSGGRNRGEESRGSFFRKGISGDWKNHFTPEVKDLYKGIFGDYLIDYGYEENHNW